MAEAPASSGPMERFQAEAARLRGEVESLVKHARVLLHGEQRARLPPRPRNPQHAARDQELEEVLERTEWFRRENKRLRDELQGMEHRFVAGPTDPRERDPMELVNLLTERRKELQRLREAGQGLNKVAERQRRAEAAQNALTPEMQARLKRVKDEVDRQKNLNVKLQSDRLKAADARKAEEALLRQEEREYRNKAKLHKPVHKAPVGEAAVPRSLRKLRTDVDIITVALRQDEKRLKAEEHEEAQQVALARRQIEQLKESIAEKRLEAERIRGARPDGDIENSQDPLPGDALPGASPNLARAAPSRPPALPHQARGAKARETPTGHRAGGLASEPWEMAAPDLAAELNSRRRPGSSGAADVAVDTPPAGALSPMRLKGRSSPSQLSGDMDEEEDEHSSTSKDLLKMAGITPSKLQEKETPSREEESVAVEDQPQREKTAFASVRPGKCPPIAEDEAERKEDGDPLEGLPLEAKDKEGPNEDNMEDGKEEAEVGAAKQEEPPEELKSEATPAVEQNKVEEEEVKEEGDDDSEKEDEDMNGGRQQEESQEGKAVLKRPEGSRAEELAASKGGTTEDKDDDEEEEGSDSSEESEEEEAPKAAQAIVETGDSPTAKPAEAVNSIGAERRSSAVGVAAAEEESEEYDEDEEDDDEEEEEEEEEEEGEETDDQEEAATPAAPSKEANASEDEEEDGEDGDSSESEEEESEEEGSSENKAEAAESSSSAGTEDEAPEPSLPASAASSGMLLGDLQSGHAGGSNVDDVLEEPEPEHEVPKAAQHRPTSGSEAEVAAGTPPDYYVPSMPQKISSGLDDLDKGSSARGDGAAASEPDAAAGTALSLRS